MKIKAIEGIIISETNYSESSKILQLFTKEYGIIGLMSKGSRKLKSKLRAFSNPLSYAKFHLYYKEDALSTLIDADIIDPLVNIQNDLKKMSYANFLLELIRQVYKQNEDEELYDILIASLKKINEGFDPLIITQIVQFKALDYLGVGLNLDCCSKCETTENIVTISIDSAGYICSDCYQDERRYSEKMYKVLRLFNYVDINKISKLELSNDTIREIDEFIDSYYDKYTGIYLITKELLKKI